MGNSRPSSPGIFTRGLIGRSDMKFPQWAPAVLIDEYHRIKDSYPWEAELIKRLVGVAGQIKYVCMEKVWRAVHRKKPGCEMGVYYDVSDAFYWSHRRPRTKAQREQHYQKIAEKARELVELLKNSVLDIAPYKWFPEGAIVTILQKIDVEKLRQTAIPLSHEYVERHI
jgi:hypothetical protein